MTGWGRGIDALYFEYQPVADHLEECPRRSTDVWEVTRFTWESYSGDKSEVTTRLACHDCGVVHFERIDSDTKLAAIRAVLARFDWESDDRQYALERIDEIAGGTAEDSGLSVENTHASEIGYAGKPEKVAGVWLHSGPRIWHGDERGPTAYLITASKEPPRRPEDVLGKVGWGLGSRGGVRWSAGLGCTGHGTVLTAADQTWSSRRAAVSWVAANSAGGVR